MKKQNFFVAIIIIGGYLALTSCAEPSTQNYKKGQALYQQQDYHAAYLQLLKSAQHGNSDAQYAVGYMLYNGIGTPANQTDAIAWLNKAAQKGNARAMAALKKLDNNAQEAAYLSPSSKP